jgi:hypothetical protein
MEKCPVMVKKIGSGEKIPPEAHSRPAHGLIKPPHGLALLQDPCTPIATEVDNDSALVGHDIVGAAEEFVFSKRACRLRPYSKTDKSVTPLSIRAL